MKRESPWIELVLPKNYLVEIGHFVAQWAYMEREFNRLLEILRFDPGVKKLEKRVPFSFKKRKTLLNKSVKIAFQNCPTLVGRVKKISEEVSSIKNERDAIAHGIWTYSSRGKEIAVYIQRKDKIIFKKMDEAFLRKRIIQTSELTRRLMAIVHSQHDFSFPLTSEEISVLRDFRMKNFPPLPKPNIHLPLARSRAKASSK